MHKTELSCQALLSRAASVLCMPLHKGVMTEEAKQNFNTVKILLMADFWAGYIFQETYSKKSPCAK